VDSTEVLGHGLRSEIEAMTSRRIGLELALSLVVGLAVACTGSAGTSAADAAAPLDLGVVNDLAQDLPEAARDASLTDVRVGDLDAADVATDRALDVGPDRGPDARSDVPGVMMAGYFIPVDPNAVPPPGSECVGDGGVREGDPTIAPPRPIRPLSVSRVTSQRPTFQWVLPAGTTGARVEVCADRCCTRVIRTFDAEGTTRPMATLPPGVVFWRMFGRRGSVVGSRPSYTWEFEVRRRDAPNDTTWGTIRDFNGDGYDDLVVLAWQTTSGNASDVLLVPGSSHGLQPPLRSGIVVRPLPRFGSTGDFNGDGIADAVWGNLLSDSTSEPGWIDVIAGTREGLRQVARLDNNGIGGCASPGLPRATDWDGDGYSDIIVSVDMRCDHFLPPSAAFLFIYRGSGRGLATVPQAVVRTDHLFLHPESYVENTLGDIDLDGYGDAYLISRFTGSGSTDVVAEHFIAYGSPDGTPRYERVVGPSQVGWVKPLGDLDGDGHVDWSLYLDFRVGLAVYRYAAGRGAPSDILFDTVSPHPGGLLGVDNDCGDMNGDGLSDAILTAPFAYDDELDGHPVDRGRVNVYAGRIGGISSAPFIVVAPPHAEDGGVRVGLFGNNPMCPGDVNGDGVDDMVMMDQVGNSLCFVYGRTTSPPTRPDGCVSGWWPRYELFL
jgi:hypothetical protein